MENQSEKTSFHSLAPSSKQFILLFNLLKIVIAFKCADNNVIKHSTAQHRKRKTNERN